MVKNKDNFTNWTKTEIFALFALVISNFGAIGGLAIWVDSRISETRRELADTRREILEAIKSDKADTDQKVSTLDDKFSNLQNSVINGLVSQKR
ncbi:MAG: hypothetical protein QM523_07360 [Candidatus Pacebacteria bacterium]|nr:hypothetical protein [Candidatus Paceibacterota bacterium]